LLRILRSSAGLLVLNRLLDASLAQELHRLKHVEHIS
jgi:hypothetical protein